MAFGVVGRNAVVRWVKESVGQVDADLGRRVVMSAIQENGIAHDRVGDIGLSGSRDGISEDRDPACLVKLYNIAGASGEAANEIEGYTGLVRLSRPKGSAVAVGAAQGNPMEKISYRSEPVSS